MGAAASGASAGSVAGNPAGSMTETWVTAAEPRGVAREYATNVPSDDLLVMRVPS